MANIELFLTSPSNLLLLWPSPSLYMAPNYLFSYLCQKPRSLLNSSGLPQPPYSKHHQ